MFREFNSMQFSKELVGVKLNTKKTSIRKPYEQRKFSFRKKRKDFNLECSVEAQEVSLQKSPCIFEYICVSVAARRYGNSWWFSKFGEI